MSHVHKRAHGEVAAIHVAKGSVTNSKSANLPREQRLRMQAVARWRAL